MYDMREVTVDDELKELLPGQMLYTHSERDNPRRQTNGLALQRCEDCSSGLNLDTESVYWENPTVDFYLLQF